MRQAPAVIPTNIVPSAGARARELQRFGQIVIADDAWVHTPAGSAHITDCGFALAQTPHTFSRPVWNNGMLAVAISVGIFTCGLGLLLLFLARQQQTETMQVETVTVDAPSFSYAERQIGTLRSPLGASDFVSWAKTWKAQVAQAS